MTLLLLADAVVPSRAQSPFRNRAAFSPVLLIMMLSEPQCVFWIHKKTFCLIDTQLSFSPWSVCLFASHKGCKNSTEKRKNVKEETFRCIFSTETGISRLESCKAFTYQIITRSFEGKQCNIWFFSALNHLVFLSMQVRSPAVACNWITARFCLCVCFIPYDSSIYFFFGEIITMSKTAGARRPFASLTQVSS